MFEGKCLDCHSDQSKFPCYYKVPGVKQLIDDDIAEARHMEMSKGFPLNSRHDIDHDLEDLSDEIGEGEMPPKL
ncbi:MAG: heme-binding domain-containing protein [Oligoflexus sp.]|nr:heme-binding domain-containing protein [Oligoflexus sp.]